MANDFKFYQNTPQRVIKQTPFDLHPSVISQEKLIEMFGPKAAGQNPYQLLPNLPIGNYAPAGSPTEITVGSPNINYTGGQYQNTNLQQIITNWKQAQQAKAEAEAAKVAARQTPTQRIVPPSKQVGTSDNPILYTPPTQAAPTPKSSWNDALEKKWGAAIKEHEAANAKKAAPVVNYKNPEGMDADAVKRMQEKLIAAGYNIGSKDGKADSKWGKMTQAAYEAYRKAEQTTPTPTGIASSLGTIPATHWRRDPKTATLGVTNQYAQPIKQLDLGLGKAWMKKGGTIHIKPENKGKFTDYCGGKVTSDCISKGKNSSDPAVRKRATFAANARKWKHKEGGVLFDANSILEKFKK